MGASLEKMNALDWLGSRDDNRYDVLEHKIKVLQGTAWHDKWQWESDQYNKWLGNFKPDEHINAMFMLSKFMYFGNETIRELMVRVYEDLYRRPIVYSIRKNNGNIKDSSFIEAEYNKILDRTRFLPPTANFAEQVLYHDLPADSNGFCTIRISNPKFGRDIALSFRKAELPNLVQWRMPGYGDYVMGLEPANCLAEDYNSMAKKELLRHIEPGQVVETCVRLSLAD